MGTKKRRDSIGLRYELNHNEGKKYTYGHFKNCGLSKSAIYYIMARFDWRGIVDHKSGAGRPKVLTKPNQKKLFNVSLTKK